MNEATFHVSLREDPTDELTWLALADWLEEDGQSRRAELLRLTRRMASLPLDERGDLPGRAEALLHSGTRPVVVEREGALGMRFSLVMPGRFLMGSLPDEPERDGVEGRHEVTLTRPFWMGVFAVTQGQWKAVTRTTPSYFCSAGEGKNSVKGMKTADFPVEQVSWVDIQAFLKQLNERADGLEYRLPTEAQWEYACRGGPISSLLPYHFARSFPALSSSQANFNGNQPYGNAEIGPFLDRTCKVGSYEPNRLGLYDMHGNVWEWCQNWSGELSVHPETDPTGPPSGSTRLYRGGCWRAYGVGCHASRRTGATPASRANYLGFRVVAVVPE